MWTQTWMLTLQPTVNRFFSKDVRKSHIIPRNAWHAEKCLTLRFKVLDGFIFNVTIFKKVILSTLIALILPPLFVALYSCTF